MPSERARALRFAGEILRKMVARDDVPEDLRSQARAALRHYPDPHDLGQMISDIEHLPHEFLDQRWLAPEDSVQGHVTGTVPGSVAKKQSTMRATESNGLQSTLEPSEWGCVRPVGREFGSPDYDRLE
ncbi:BPSL0761 family protein [Hydrogenophaga sp. RWCD_12]|uniref:BPSL0761 family protein n=1 Tax=Hydrogenophaga sp. RWCD_12 TaxID=3391190 RepID=UPI003984DC4F